MDASLILNFLWILDDHSRVKLQNTDNDYINASQVVIEEAQRYYILTQVSSTNYWVIIGIENLGKGDLYSRDLYLDGSLGLWIIYVSY